MTGRVYEYAFTEKYQFSIKNGLNIFEFTINSGLDRFLSTPITDFNDAEVIKIHRKITNTRAAMRNQK